MTDVTDNDRDVYYLLKKILGGKGYDDPADMARVKVIRQHFADSLGTSAERGQVFAHAMQSTVCFWFQVGGLSKRATQNIPDPRSPSLKRLTALLVIGRVVECL